MAWASVSQQLKTDTDRLSTKAFVESQLNTNQGKFNEAAMKDDSGFQESCPVLCLHKKYIYAALQEKKDAEL